MTAIVASAGLIEPAPSTHRPQTALLTLGATGVVFGDIGTSPLYAMKEVFVGHHPLGVDRLHIFGALSLMFWSLMLIVTIKYVAIILRADNKGEGGSLSLLALIQRSIGGRKWGSGLVLLGVAATALFFGDAMITPAVSVLSAVEGLETVSSGLSAYVIPLAIVILIGLFAIQSRGTDTVGKLFGPDHAVLFSRHRRAWHSPDRAGSAGVAGAEPALGGALLCSGWSRRLSRARLGRACGDRSRSALRRHGPFRTAADHAGVAVPRLSGAPAQLFRPRRPDAAHARCSGEPFLS